MAGRASIVGAAVSHVGNVRSHNEDAHFIDADEGLFVVCDGMGGHAAGEVASALAVNVIRRRWGSNEVHNAEARWLAKGTPETRKALMDELRAGVVAAHESIIAEANRDDAKQGMGTTLVGAVVIGGECLFAHAGDSRAYLVRDGIAMQLTEDHTLLARLMAAGVEVDVTGEGSRFKSMLTNALGIGAECKVSTFVVPLADGDRFLLCSDGITEYVPEAEVGEVLTKQPSPARAAQKLVDLALERGGADNATALVVRVLEAGEQPQSAETRKRDDAAIASCMLYGRLNPQQRLRAQRIALPRDYPKGEKLPAQTLGDRVAWIVLEGEAELDGKVAEPGALLYPEALIADRPLPDRDGLWVAASDVRVLALRSDDFRELCEDDDELAEVLLEGLNVAIGSRGVTTVVSRAPTVKQATILPGALAYEPTQPDAPALAAVADAHAHASGPRKVDPLASTDPDIRVGAAATERIAAVTPDDADADADPDVEGTAPTLIGIVPPPIEMSSSPVEIVSSLPVDVPPPPSVQRIRPPDDRPKAISGELTLAPTAQIAAQPEPVVEPQPVMLAPVASGPPPIDLPPGLDLGAEPAPAAEPASAKPAELASNEPAPSLELPAPVTASAPAPAPAVETSSVELDLDELEEVTPPPTSRTSTVDPRAQTMPAIPPLRPRAPSPAGGSDTPPAPGSRAKRISDGWD